VINFYHERNGLRRRIALQINVEHCASCAAMKILQVLVLVSVCVTIKMTNALDFVVSFPRLLENYLNCHNVVVLCDIENTLLPPVPSPISLITGYNYRQTKPSATSSKFISCIAVYFLFPERRTTLIYGFQFFTKFNVPFLTAHIFTTEPGPLESRMRSGSIHWRTYRNDIRLILHKLTEIERTVKTTTYCITSSHFYFQFTYPDSIPFNLTEKSKNHWRETIEKSFSAHTRLGKLIVSSERQGGPSVTRRLNMGRHLSHLLGSPFQFFNSIRKERGPSFEDVVRALILHMLDVHMEDTLLTDSDGFETVMKSYYMIWVIGDFIRYNRMAMIDLRYQLRRPELQLVLTGSHFKNFVTCDGVSTKFSFAFYTSPYDLPSWATFLVFILAILPILILCLERCCTTTEGFVFNQLYHIVSFLWSASLEVSPNTSFENNLKRTKVILLHWLIAMVILTNAYKGLVTSDLTLPRKPTGKWTNITDMSGFVFVFNAETHHEILKAKKLERDQNWESGFGMIDIFGAGGCECFPQNPEFVDTFCRTTGFFHQYKFDSCQANSLELSSRNIKLPNIYEMYCRRTGSIKPILEVFLNGNNFTNYLKGLVSSLRRNYNKDPLKYREFFSAVKDFCQSQTLIYKRNETYNMGRFLFPSPSAFLFELYQNSSKSTLELFDEVIKITSNCDHTAYLDYDSKLNAFLSYNEIKEESPHYVKGKADVLGGWDAIIITSGPQHPDHASYLTDHSPSLYSSMQLLMSSGIYLIWNEYYYRKFPTEEQEVAMNVLRSSQFKNLPTPLALGTNVSTAFILYFACILGAVVVLFIEILKRCGNNRTKIIVMGKKHCTTRTITFCFFVWISNWFHKRRLQIRVLFFSFWN